MKQKRKSSKVLGCSVLLGGMMALISTDVMGYSQVSVTNMSGQTMPYNTGLAFSTGNGSGYGGSGSITYINMGANLTTGIVYNGNSSAGINGQTVYPACSFNNGISNVYLPVLITVSAQTGGTIIAQGMNIAVSGASSGYNYGFYVYGLSAPVTHYTNQACFNIVNSTSSPSYYSLAYGTCSGGSPTIYNGDASSVSISGYSGTNANSIIGASSTSMLQVLPGQSYTVCYTYLSTNNQCLQACLLQGDATVVDCIPIGDSSVIVTGCVNGTPTQLFGGQNATTVDCANMTQWSSGSPTVTNSTANTQTNLGGGTTVGTNGLPVPIAISGTQNGVMATNPLTQGTGLAGFETLNNDLIGLNNEESANGVTLGYIRNALGTIIAIDGGISNGVWSMNGVGSNAIAAANSNSVLAAVDSTNVLTGINTMNTNLANSLHGVTNLLAGLPTNAGSGGQVGVTNFPTNFPDAAAIALLAALNSNATTQDVLFSGMSSNISGLGGLTNTIGNSNGAALAAGSVLSGLGGMGTNAGTVVGNDFSNLATGTGLSAPTLGGGADGQTLSITGGGIITPIDLTIAYSGLPSGVQSVLGLLKETVAWSICIGLVFLMMKDTESSLKAAYGTMQVQGSSESVAGTNASLVSGIAYSSIIIAVIAAIPVAVVTYIALYKANAGGFVGSFVSLSGNAMWTLVTSGFPIDTVVTAFFDYITFRFVVLVPATMLAMSVIKTLVA